MIKNIIHGVSGYILYKGGLPHYTFLIHRISGLGTLAFLSLHILLESTAHFIPQVYDQLNASLRTPAGLTAEIVMALLVIFHGINGFRIACFDLYPNLLGASFCHSFCSRRVDRFHPPLASIRRHYGFA